MVRRVAGVVAWTLVLGSAAGGQTVPASALPGREGQQFTPPIAPLSRPANPFKLPETMAPEAAAGGRLRVKSITVEGSTVYSAADFEPLYADLIGKEGWSPCRWRMRWSLAHRRRFLGSAEPLFRVGPLQRERRLVQFSCFHACAMFFLVSRAAGFDMATGMFEVVLHYFRT